MDELRRRFGRLDDVAMPDLWREIERRAAPTMLEPVTARRTTGTGVDARRLVLLLTAMALLIALAAAYGAGGRREQDVPGLTWPGLTERVLSDLPAARSDPRDAAPSWIDIVGVGSTRLGQPHWRLELAGKPPDAASLDPSVTVISYGIVLETTGDAVADYVVGLSNDAPRPGQYRAWVTNVATGRTEEQIGPPYGFPVEFSHPDEADDATPEERTVTFTFLSGSTPPGIPASRFYAWSTLTERGVVVAWDYAPDNAWAGPSFE